MKLKQKKSRRAEAKTKMEDSDQIRQIQKRYNSIAMFIAIIIGLGLILAGKPWLGKGLILGTLFAVLNFVAMGLSLPYRLGVSRKKATAVSGLSILTRYVLLAIPLVMAIRMDQFNLAATICGLFMIQFLILTEHILRLYFPATSKKADF